MLTGEPGDVTVVTGHCKRLQEIAGYYKDISRYYRTLQNVQDITGQFRILQGITLNFRILQDISGYCRKLQNFITLLQDTILQRHCRTDIAEHRHCRRTDIAEH